MVDLNRFQPALTYSRRFPQSPISSAHAFSNNNNHQPTEHEQTCSTKTLSGAGPLPVVISSGVWGVIERHAELDAQITSFSLLKRRSFYITQTANQPPLSGKSNASFMGLMKHNDQRTISTLGA